MMINNNILLINPSGWQKESINLGLSYIAAALKAAGFPVLIVDLNAATIPDAVLIKRVADYAPAIIGISVKTATANEGGRIADLLAAEFKDAVFICGGPHITLCVESYMTDFPAFQYGIPGEGEETIVALVNALQKKHPVDSIQGVAYRQGNQIAVNKWLPPENLDALPLPDIDAIEGFDWEDFRYPVVTSRGCPFDCTYCCVNKLTGSRRWRARSVKNVVDELDYRVQTRGIKSFEIWDDNFTLDIKRAKAICAEIIKRKLKLSWYCHNGIRADRLDLELAKLMKQAGCTSVAFGIESGNPETFDSIKKGEPLSAVVNAVNLVNQAGMDAVGYFIIGLPGDNLDRFIDTIRFQRTLKLRNHVFGMLIPYPRTEVWDMVKARGTMFCDITNTQHFNDDIVPICYEMPEFPRADMIRAYYIAKYFSLYDAVEQISRQGMTPVVLYRAHSHTNPLLAGMITACPPGTKHIIVGGNKDSIINHPSFSQLPAGMNISYCDAIPVLSPDEALIFIWQRGLSKHFEDILRNATLLLIDPGQLSIEIRKYLKAPSALPDFIWRGITTLYGVCRILQLFGAEYLRNARKSLAAKIFHIKNFLLTKMKLRQITIKPGKDYRCNEYNSYL